MRTVRVRGKWRVTLIHDGRRAGERRPAVLLLSGLKYGPLYIRSHGGIPAAER